MEHAHGTKTATERFLPVYLESLRIDSVLDFDLYVITNNEFVLYRAADLPFTEKTRHQLLENNVSKLYISGKEQRTYQRYIEANINRIIDDSSIDDITRANIVYDNSRCLVRDILDNPTLGENIKRGQAVVESTVSYVLKGQNAFHSLLKVMSFDYYTYSHCVNVCTFSLALAQYMGIDDTAELNFLGTGALLHDVGKTCISESILNKRGPLTDDEMDLMKNHPQWGGEIIRETNLIPEVSYHPILQHHERNDGSGYPDGIGAEDIHPYSQIVAIADVFDAMTTQRAYRSAVSSFQALNEMFADQGALSQQHLDQFARLMGPAS
jgi:putative nucleotidyltransferase with HDIG domain